jgi:predicted permease
VGEAGVRISHPVCDPAGDDPIGALSDFRVADDNADRPRRAERFVTGDGGGLWRGDAAGRCDLGLPLALFAFGETGLGYAVVVFAIMAIWSFTFGIWLVAGSGSFGKVIREPLVWGTALGALFLVQGWETPVFLTNTLSLLGQMAIPIMLITLGVAVARLSPGGIGRAVVLSLIKLAICIGIAALAGWFFDLDKIAFGVLVLQVATPVAVTSYLLAEKYGADAESVAGLVVVSTVLSVAALPLMLGFLL